MGMHDFLDKRCGKLHEYMGGLETRSDCYTLQVRSGLQTLPEPRSRVKGESAVAGGFWLRGCDLLHRV